MEDVAILARVPSAPLRGELNNRAKRDTIILNFQFSILNYSKRRSQWKSYLTHYQWQYWS